MTDIQNTRGPDQGSDLPHASLAPRPNVMKSLLHAREALMRQLRPTLRMHGLTEQQWRVLSDLMTVEEIAASDLAAATCLRASSLSRIIKDLENRGYLRRRSQLEDLRRTMISVTSRGRTLMQMLVPVIDGIHADIAARFGQDRLDSMIELSEDLVDAFGTGGASDEDGE